MLDVLVKEPNILLGSHTFRIAVLLLAASFAFAESTQVGRIHSDILIFDIASKLYICTSGPPRGLHPFLKLEHLTKYLFKYCEDNPDRQDLGTKMIFRTQR